VRWSSSGQPTRLVGLLTAVDVTADGSAVLGLGRLPSREMVAMIWADSDLQTLEKFNPEAISADGAVAVGRQAGQAARWMMDRLDVLELARSSRAVGVSADGGVAAGTRLGVDRSEAFRWEGDQVEYLGLASEAHAISSDATTVVGALHAGPGQPLVEAFRWRPDGVERLGQLSAKPGELAHQSVALGVSADGSVVVGRAHTTAGGPTEAFIWTHEKGIRSLAEVLEREFLLDLQGLRLTEAVAVSDDGRVIVGNASVGRGVAVGWMAVLGHDAIDCGDVVTTDARLDFDLNCPGDGIVIGAPGIRLDLNSREIRGAGSAGSVGIRNRGYDGVSIVNGDVSGFDTGISLEGSRANELGRLVVDATRRGVVLQESTANRLDRVSARVSPRAGEVADAALLSLDSNGNQIKGDFRADGSGLAARVLRSHENGFQGSFIGGLLLQDSHRNRIGGFGLSERSDAARLEHSDDNTLGGRWRSGAGNAIALVDSRRCRVEAAEVAGSSAGILLERTRDVLLRGNDARHQGEFGVRLLDSRRTLIEGNQLSAGVGLSVEGSRDVEIVENAAVSSLRDGIYVDSRSRDVRISGNTVVDNGDDGIDVRTAAARLDRNQTAMNGGRGIRAVSGARDGGHNTAARNQGSKQCSGLRCRWSPLIGGSRACGLVLREDAVVSVDVRCAGDGLVVGADAIRIDLAGKGVAAGRVGIRNEGHDRVRIENGWVSASQDGVLLRGARRNRLSDLRVDGERRGIVLEGGDHNRIERSHSGSNECRPRGAECADFWLEDSHHNTLTENFSGGGNWFRRGIRLLGSRRNRLEANRILEGYGFGILLTESDDNRIVANAVEDYEDAQLMLERSDRNRILRNTFDGYTNGSGVELVASDDNLVRENTISGGIEPEHVGVLLADGRGNRIELNEVSGYRGIVVEGGSGNRIDENTVSWADEDGIAVSSTGTRIARNVVEHNGDDGIEVLDSRAQLERNVARYNVDLGIEARSARDGGGNRSLGNGNAAGCLGVTCEPEPRRLHRWNPAAGGNGHWYEVAVAPRPVAPQEAFAEAERQGGYLVSITSEAEGDFVFALADSADYWLTRGPDFLHPLDRGIGPLLGLSRTAGADPVTGWTWVSGEPFVYSRWRPGAPTAEPAQAFACFARGTTPPRTPLWEHPTSPPIAYVIEYDALPPGFAPE
jgi:parallel beta-helix repeat protein